MDYFRRASNVDHFSADTHVTQETKPRYRQLSGKLCFPGTLFLFAYLIMLMFIYCSNKSIIRKLNTQNDVTLHGARNRSPCIIKKLHAHAHCGFDEPFLQKLTFFEFSGFNKQCLNQKACVGWIHLSQNTRRDNWQAVVNMVENSLVLERATANLLTRCSAVLVRYLETQMDKN